MGPQDRDDIRPRLVRADELAKVAGAATDPAAVRDRARGLLADVRDDLDDLRRMPGADLDGLDELSRQVSRRMLDLDGADLARTTRPSGGLRAAPTSVDDPARHPPNQHLTAGFPVLHVGRAPADVDDWALTVSGRVGVRSRWSLADLQRDPDVVTTTSDFHCVTGWSRLDNDWTGVRVSTLLDRVDVARDATHLLAYGHPSYSANLDLASMRAPDVVVAWAHDGSALSIAHGGPLRLVVPPRYGWKSVKWLTELRLVDRDVPGYWEERGYHMQADPWREQRLRGD